MCNSHDSLGKTRLFDSSESRVSINYDGFVDWYTLGVLTTGCSLDLTYYPFDYQSCYIHLEWLVSGLMYNNTGSTHSAFFLFNSFVKLNCT